MFCKYRAFTSSAFTFFKNSRQTYALHLMNLLLNKFCYIISNVSNRKNLHRVQLMTESYPDRQNYSKKQCLLCVQGGMARFAQSIWGNQVKIRRISQRKKGQRHTSQMVTTIPRSIWGNQIKIQRISQGRQVFNHHPKFVITGGMSLME